jgi:hypothetical protein
MVEAAGVEPARILEIPKGNLTSRLPFRIRVRIDRSEGHNLGLRLPRFEVALSGRA